MGVAAGSPESGIVGSCWLVAGAPHAKRVKLALGLEAQDAAGLEKEPPLAKDGAARAGLDSHGFAGDGGHQQPGGSRIRQGAGRR